LVPLLLLALVRVGFQVTQYRRVGGNRKVRLDWLSSGVVAVAFPLLILGEKWRELPAQPVRGAAFLIAGMRCFVISLVSRQRRVGRAASVALVPLGIALPLCSPQQQVALVGGMAVTVAGIVAAGILAGQLRAERNIRERVTN
jgi:hypothetical protein